MKDKAPASDNSIFGIFSQIFSFIFETLAEIWKLLWPMVTTAVSFILWVLAAVIIMPCIFVAGTIYPMWEKWGENF